MKLVEDWKQAWKWISTNCMMLAAAIQGAWVYIPQDLRSSLPEWGISITTIALLIFGIAGRLIKQESKGGA